jgi:hypothetical protein
VISIPSPRLGDRNHTTGWIKIISHHKPWEILYISVLTFRSVKKEKKKERGKKGRKLK